MPRSSVGPFLLLCLLTLPPSLVRADSLESETLVWAEEKVAQFREARRVGAAAEWQRKIDEQDHEWLAVSLAVLYSIEKRVNEGLKGERANTPILNDKLERLRGRLVRLGEYVIRVNGGPED